MSRFTLMENLPDLLIASTTTVTMASSFLGKPTRISVGGFQNLYTSLTTLNFATTGLNALDTGTISLNTLYYLYAVKSSGGVAGLVASTAAPSVGPSGYTAWREIGRCRTLSSAATLATITNRVGGTSSLTLGGSEWITFTPTGSWSTNTTYAGRYRRSVSVMEIMVGITLAGAPNAATQLALNMLTGFTLDTTQLPITARAMNLGEVTTYRSGYTAPGWTEYDPTVSNGTLKARFFAMDAAGSTNVEAPITTTVPGTWASGDYIEMNLKLPISEWAGLYT